MIMYKELKRTQFTSAYVIWCIIGGDCIEED